MLHMIENCVFRFSSRLLRRCFSKNFDVQLTNAEEFISQLNQDITSVRRRKDEKCLKIAILGAPNVGKSTLVNQLIKRSVIIKLSKKIIFSYLYKK